MRWSSSRISPSSGQSRVPSRCSSVLFPEPDRPTMLRNSPGTTSRSRPRSTVVTLASLRYVLCKLMAVSMALFSDSYSPLPSPPKGRGEKKGSLKAQGADRVEPGGTQRRQHAEQYRDHDGAQVHQQHARRLDVGRDAVEVVDAAVENLLSRHLGEELLDLVDVVGKGQSQRGPEGGSNHAEQEPVDQEDFHHAAVGSAQRFENADVARLLDDDHREDRQDTEASHGDDHE